METGGSGPGNLPNRFVYDPVHVKTISKAPRTPSVPSTIPADSLTDAARRAASLAVRATVRSSSPGDGNNSIAHNISQTVIGAA